MLFANPKLVTLLCILFRSMALHNNVPANFGKGITVPLIKDKMGNIYKLSCNNNRAIILIAVISKLFEKVGSRKNLGCNQVIFTVRNTVDYFTDRRSPVYAAALDVSTAYGKVQHYKIFTSLVRSGLPMWVVSILVDWYSKLSVMVRWNQSFSSYFKVGSGVRQGSTISSALFNIFINKVIVDLESQKLGCAVNKTWVGLCG